MSTTDTFTQPFQFTGRENDGATGLYYYRARYYSPTLKRFITEDPLRFEAGDVNWYAYVGGNPTNFTDPWGLEGGNAFEIMLLEGVPGLQREVETLERQERENRLEADKCIDNKVDKCIQLYYTCMSNYYVPPGANDIYKAGGEITKVVALTYGLSKIAENAAPAFAIFSLFHANIACIAEQVECMDGK